MNSFVKKLALSTASISLIFSATACAQQQKPTPIATTQVAASEVELGGPALWKVADEDTTIYMFGTVHALPANVDWNSGAVNDALMSADELVTEIDLTPETMAGMQAIIMEKALLTDGRTLRSLMSDEQRTQYEAGLARIGIPAAALDPLEPWFAALQVANAAMAKAGISPDMGVEKVLEEAIAPGTGRGALETLEFQLSIFDELPEELQLEYLLETVEQSEEIAPMLQTIIDGWAVGDVDAVAALLNESMAEDPLFAERLLYARNANWAVWIDERLDRPGIVFMAVGAGHLAGEKSVQLLLEERGITNVRVQ